jgi:hypothetical protein
MDTLNMCGCEPAGIGDARFALRSELNAIVELPVAQTGSVLLVLEKNHLERIYIFVDAV